MKRCTRCLTKETVDTITYDEQTQRWTIEATGPDGKADVREELDRLKAHLSQARELLSARGAQGRRLDAAALQRGLDVLLALLGLLHHVVRDAHGGVVETGGAGNEHPGAGDDGAAVAEGLLEGRSGRNPFHAKHPETSFRKASALWLMRFFSPSGISAADWPRCGSKNTGS